MSEYDELTTRTYGPGYRPVPQDPERCVEAVYSGWASHQCRSKRGKGLGGLYCGRHDPEAVAARSEEALARFREKLDNSPLALTRRRAEAAEAEVERLKGVLELVRAATEGGPDHVSDDDIWAIHGATRKALEAKP